MNTQSDQQLLRDYVENRSEPAFAALVRRHIDLVYSAAWRRVRDAHQAQDVTQGTFVALAQNAAQLKQHPVLSGWLHRTTQNIAANLVRANVRRQAREQEAVTMNELLSAAPDASWETIAPHLDAALDELDAADRDAVLLRYFERKSAREIAQTLGTSEEAAQKRVSRAVERLREFFAKRGVAVGASGLSVIISANAVQAAPVGLALTISTAAALTGTTLATTATITATKAIAMTALQKTIVTATIAVLAGAGIYEARQAAQLHSQVETLQQQQAPLAEQIQVLQRERDEARSQLAAIREDKERTPDNAAELLRLRGMAGVARRANAEAEQLRAKLARQTSEGASNPITGAMADAAKQAMEQQADGRLSRMTASLHLTPEQTQAAREILMKQAQAMSVGMQQAFSGKYDQEELFNTAKKAGNTEEQIKALLTPDQKAGYQNYQRDEAAYNAQLAANQELLQLQSALGLTSEQQDRAFAVLYEENFNQFSGSTKPVLTNQADPLAIGVEQLEWAMDQKARALEPVLTASQLESYRQQQAIQVKLTKDIMSKMKGSENAR